VFCLMACICACITAFVRFSQKSEKVLKSNNVNVICAGRSEGIFGCSRKLVLAR